MMVVGESAGATLLPGYSRNVQSARAGDIASNMMAFCAVLRSAGFSAGTGEVADALGALTVIDMADWREVYYTLRTIFVCRREEVEPFDALFHRYWTGWGGLSQSSQQLMDTEVDPYRNQLHGFSTGPQCIQPDDERGSSANEQAALAVYSPESRSSFRSFNLIQDSELRSFRRIVSRLRRDLASRPGRRTEVVPKSHAFNMRRTIRKNIQFGGDILNFSHRARQVRRVKLVLLLDVSRSMDVHAMFLLKLVYSLSALKGKTETFVFGTDLKRITGLFRGEINVALANVAGGVPFWSGGTRIGHCLGLFNRNFAEKLVSKDSVVVILSDGLDADAAVQVAEEMAELKSRAEKIVWLNPLADSPGYEPIAQAMAAAYPFVDRFGSVHDLLKGTLVRTGR